MAATSSLRAVLTAPEAARHYGLSRRYLVYLVSRKLLAGRKAGGTWLIEAESLRSHMKTRRPRGRPKRQNN